MKALIVLCGSSIPEWDTFNGLFVMGLAGATGLALASALKAIGLYLSGWWPYHSWMRDGLLLTLISGVGGLLTVVALPGRSQLMDLPIDIEAGQLFTGLVAFALVTVFIDGVVLNYWMWQHQSQAINVDDQGQLTVEGFQRAQLSPWQTALIANTISLGLIYTVILLAAIRFK